MNPGLSEEGGETARTLISSLHDSPLTLALVLFNIIFIAVVGYGTLKEREWRADIFKMMNENQIRYAEMLYNCRPYSQEEKRQQ